MNTHVVTPLLRGRRGFATMAALLAVTALMVSVAFSRSGASVVDATHNARPAKVVAEERVGPRLVDLTIRSSALGGTGKVRLLTPDGWNQRQRGDSWPVLWLLDGGGGDYQGWTNDTDVEELPELRDTLVVMPGMPLFGFYSNWYNNGTGGPPATETFHLDELRPLLERHYGAGNRRAIAGLSQGGYGALAYVARRPGMFEAAASYSGWLHPLQHPDVVVAAAAFASDLLGDGSLTGAEMWGDPVAQRHIWEANDLYHQADRLTGTPVYIASGDGAPGELDPPDLEREELFPELDRLAETFPGAVDLTEAVMNASSQAVAGRLQTAGAPVTTHFYPGTHSPVYWERELHNSLPMLLDAIHDRAS